MPGIARSLYDSISKCKFIETIKNEVISISNLSLYQNIPMFLPVMRGTLSGSSSRDPEILERLQPIHFHNICNRMLTHYNICASKVAAEQQLIGNKIKEVTDVVLSREHTLNYFIFFQVDHRIAKLFAAYVEKQKAYAVYAEQFSKIRSISQHLTRCNNLLNQNIESLEALNNMLDVEDRLEPFVWKTD